MKKIILSTFITLLFTAISFAQTYTTPNTGVVWTLDDIATASPTTITISGNNYSLLENLEIAENDTVIIDTDLTLAIDSEILVTVFGTFTVDSDAVTITAIDETMPYEGFRFEEFSEIEINNATIEYGGGLRVLTDTFSIDNCTLTNNVSGATTSAVIQLSGGMPQITNNTISFNENPAIGSAANSAVSAYIFNNTIEGNNQANSNRPQINIGTTMANEPLEIIQNTIIGDPVNEMAGGIAIANFTGGSINAIIDDNIIQNNRYGITIIGSCDSALIRGNVIEDNNTQGDPNLGGSGISLNTSAGVMNVVASGNEFRRNLWGITVIGTASINLGDDADNPGENIFSENGNNGETFAIYNNTANTIQAINNCWIEGELSTAEEVEDVIFHVVDDASLGEVIYTPFDCAVLNVAENDLSNFGFYPNPSRGEINFNNTFGFSEMKIFGIAGNLLKTEAISEGENTFGINLPSGVYFVNFKNEKTEITKKLVVQ
ncbi:T9SS type A sorting domain-containing protein [Aequorivita echinoideorum]|uniref:T9SS type A sorting domain-containing protein n=1 Tax=Aequorivita echinoideorum TaxID=1549647 RepID=A0ABS5S4L1_9FLAO|nr:T9SS type A sorting domain-containing protein [Aequorivita echinoideorum]MBT0606790.1 T9SS type A sorting domain-containing protein [Aequorivita echinoideorum]